MRPSPLRHPLAVLRQVIGISQKELADIIGRSSSAIQAIELRKLNLSEDLAAKIEEATGVSANWLLSGDVNRPIENSLGASYLKDDYELARAKRSKLPAHVDATTMEMCHASGLICGERLARVFAAAMRAKPSKFQVAMFLAWKWIDEIEQKFGEPGEDYLEYRSRLRVSTEDARGFTRELHFPFMPARVSELDRSNFLRSVAETEGQELADRIAADDAARKTSMRKGKKAEGSSKSPV